ncbi:MAG: GNAT family N-acetyltransferase [Gaiellaceae bacterium]
MLVRAAVPEDAEAIARVHVRAWQVGYAHVFPPEKLAGIDEAARARQWREGLESDWSALVLDDGSGFASVGPSRDVEGEGELYAIYVSPEHWDTGRGRALMERAVEDLRAQGFEEATLWVLEDNPRARRFYEAASWRLDGATKQDEFLDTPVHEVRYRISLR